MNFDHAWAEHYPVPLSYGSRAIGKLWMWSIKSGCNQQISHAIRPN